MAQLDYNVVQKERLLVDCDRKQDQLLGQGANCDDSGESVRTLEEKLLDSFTYFQVQGVITVIHWLWGCIVALSIT
jgi:hypothetical protein